MEKCYTKVNHRSSGGMGIIYTALLGTFFYSFIVIVLLQLEGVVSFGSIVKNEG